MGALAPLFLVLGVHAPDVLGEVCTSNCTTSEHLKDKSLEASQRRNESGKSLVCASACENEGGHAQPLSKLHEGRSLKLSTGIFSVPKPHPSSSSTASSALQTVFSSTVPVAKLGSALLCRELCSGMCTQLQHAAQTSAANTSDDGDTSTTKLILVLTNDNLIALLIICLLTVLGAIYLWKICTRKRCSCRICRNQYRELDLLGSGGYGSVYLTKRVTDGTNFVSKKIQVREITRVDECSREAKDLVALRHKHIVSYEDDFVHIEYGGFEPKTFIIIIMEYCPFGDLKEKIERDFECFTEEWVRKVFVELLEAVQYLHSKNVIHRDLKSQNVFFAEDKRVRLGDFGLCKHTRNVGGTMTLTHAGTDCYMAPEMLTSSKYGKPADMWSLGCVLYELCTGQFMWELEGMLGAMIMTDKHIAHKLIHGGVVASITPPLVALLKRLLSCDPSARLTATECIRRKLFKHNSSMSQLRFGELFDRDFETEEMEVVVGSEAEEEEEINQGEIDYVAPVNFYRKKHARKRRTHRR